MFFCFLFSFDANSQKKGSPAIVEKSTKKKSDGTKTSNPVSGLKLLAKHKNNMIVLRWAPLNPDLWMLGNQYGYILEKTVVRRNGKTLPKPEASSQIKLLPASKNAWVSLAESVKYAKIIKNFMFDSPLPTSEKDTSILHNAIKARHVFSLLCADFSPETAHLMRLSYTDSLAKENELYRYKVTLNVPTDSVKGMSDDLVAGLNLNIPQFAPKGLIDADFADSTTTLNWEYPKFSIFSAYNIERSDDNGTTYQKVNQDPFLPLENAQRFQEIVYGNKVPKLHKTYLYRVKGIDPFGDESESSNSVSVYAYQTRLVGGQNLSYSFPNKDYVALKWQFPDSLNINIKGFHVYKTTNMRDLKKVSKQVVPVATHYFLDNIKDNDENMFYIVSAVDLRQKETQSEPLLVIIIDTIAPIKVSNMKGKIDKKGIVKISWKAGPDKDIYNYNVMRAEGHDRYKMFVIKSALSSDTSLIDTISLKAPSRKIHYIIIPIDNHSNASKINDTLTLIRPDIFPLEPPRFVSKYETDSSIVIGWGKSISDDVEMYNLYKRNMPDTTKRLLIAFKNEVYQSQFIDLDYQEEQSIQYVLQAVDCEGLSSGDSCRLDMKVYKPLRIGAVNNLSVKHLKQDKKIHLQWQYFLRKPLSSFIIFRKKEGGSLTKIGEVGGDVREYFDDKIQADNTYTYSIIAFRFDNIRSLSGKEVMIKVK